MNTELLKSKLLEAAFNGSLTHANTNKWEFVNLNDVCEFDNGYAFASGDYKTEGIPLVRISNIQNNEIDLTDAVCIQGEYPERFVIHKGDLLIAMSGATTGKMGIYNLERKAYLNQRVGKIRIKDEQIILPKYRNFFFQNQTDNILRLAYGSAQPNISGKMILSLVVPLPPIAEQQRIVAVLEEGFAYIDTIASAKQNLSDSARLLRNKILQAAISGTLVDHCIEDEPASLLLDRLRKEKEELDKKNLIPRKPFVPPISSDWEKPFDIPQNWVWCYLAEVSLIQEGAGIMKHQYRDNGIQLLTVTNIKEGDINMGNHIICIEKDEYNLKYKNLTLNKGDIVTACSGGSWGKTAIFDKDGIYMLNTSTLRLRFWSDLACNKYLYYLSKTKFFKSQLEEQLSGLQPNFGYAHYSKIAIPLPPLAEQQRIVAKIEELFAEIDKLVK